MMNGKITRESALAFSLRRLEAHLSLSDERKVVSVQDATTLPNVGPTFEISVSRDGAKPEKFGSARTWSGKGEISFDGDGYYAHLVEKDGAVFVRRTAPGGHSRSPQGDVRLCAVADIRAITGYTADKWRGEFRPLRGVDEPAGDHDQWVCIWHRSDGSVTIVTEWEQFPDHIRAW